MDFIVPNLSYADTFELDPERIRDISGDALDDTGRLRVLPAAYWATTTPDERALFGHRFGLYSFPTDELVEHLRDFIARRSAIEIGAGHGVLADALGIRATDNRMQEKPPYDVTYALSRQPTVPYGANVIDCDASQAVRRYNPRVVVACWVTHKYDPLRHWAGGNHIGVDEMDVLRHCEEYVFVGNERTHRGKVIWDQPHKIEYPPFVYSRSRNDAREFIAYWQGIKQRKPKRRPC